jgi:hypothetical protein
MINAPQLLIDLKRRLTELEADLRERISAIPSLEATLQAEWKSARDANRTAETFESWVDQVITQAGVHWLLSCVFLRFIEDNGLVARPWIGGTPDSGRLNLARDRHEAYFRANPLESDREYLLGCFVEAGKLPGLHTFFDEAHNPVFRLGISGDAAMGLRQFWQQQDPNTGALLHDFTDSTWNTRFLGDLYQDLSEATRKRYALLQTPEFVEEFILDRTLTPAIREFGYRETRMIDPTCGSGHFLLGGFQRMVAEWSSAEPTRNRRDVAQKALDSVCGVDLNPFAVAISRFRLLLAALQASDVHRLSEAPDFQVNVAIGDSLLHGKRFGMKDTDDMFQSAEDFADTGLSHAYASEDLADVQRILDRQYHAVVGNPPYIVVKDAALSIAYRNRYASCHRKYSLGAPFTERFFELAVTGKDSVGGNAGFIGLITANSFMKREFGSKLIEQVLPRLDLTHVIDTSGAHIPGHGTPTVILFGRHRSPVDEGIRTVRGIKGEPSTPDDPRHGLVWSSIVDQVDRVGSESAFVSVADTDRSTFAKHPWSIGGGGATDLFEALSERTTGILKDFTSVIGRTTHTGEDGAFFVSPSWQHRNGLNDNLVPLIEGGGVRDFSISSDTDCIFPYEKATTDVLLKLPKALERHFWTYRRSLKARKDFGNFIEDRGLLWYEHSMFFPRRFRSKMGIAFAFVATHNHFSLDRGGKLFKQSAPVIILREDADEDEHLGFLGLLNSSLACFWLQQVCHNKGGPGGGSSKDEKWHDFYEFASTAIAELPVVADRPVEWARRIDSLAQQLLQNSPRTLISRSKNDSTPVSRVTIDRARQQSHTLRQQMIAAQEELDWHCYSAYGLLPTPLETQTPPAIALGERAFEIAMARRVASGSIQTRWFEWLGITPIIELPASWSNDYRELVERRIELIESDRSIGLLEAPSCKRRWETTTWDEDEQAALRDWLLARLELPRYWATSADQPPSLTSTSRLADATRQDLEFVQMGTLYAGHADFDHSQLVADLIVGEAVPFLPVLRYTDTGLRKHIQWKTTWALQRREDDIDAQVEATAEEKRQRLMSIVSVDGAELDAHALERVETTLHAELNQEKTDRNAAEIGSIAVPPKFQVKDFIKADVWRLRGGLDVPKERWISYPGCERGVDGSLVIAWAGWNHLQQASAIAGYYLDMKDNEGWAPERLQVLLAGLLDLLPWLVQWHNEVDPAYGERMGDYYCSFVAEEARTLGLTLDDLRNWVPTKVTAKRGRKAKA